MVNLFGKKNKCRRGMTLVEVMITTAIIGIVFGIGPVIFINAIKFYNLNRSRMEVQADARILLDIINRNLRQAQYATITIDNLAGQPPYSRITFLKVQGTPMSFYQQNGKLYMNSGTVNRVMSQNLRYVAFTFPMTDDMTLVSISMTMERETYEGQAKAMHLAVEKVRVMN